MLWIVYDKELRDYMASNTLTNNYDSIRMAARMKASFWQDSD